MSDDDDVVVFTKRPRHRVIKLVAIERVLVGHVLINSRGERVWTATTDARLSAGKTWRVEVRYWGDGGKGNRFAHTGTELLCEFLE